MLLNNLDPRWLSIPSGSSSTAGLARRPGARGAARDRPVAPRLGDDETLLVQTASRSVFSVPAVGASRPHRERAARPAMGDLGRVPRLVEGSAHDVRPDDGRELDLHRDPGDPAGGTYQTFAAAGERHFGLRTERPDDPDGRARGHGRGAAARGDDGGAAILCVEVDPSPDRAATRDALPRRGRGCIRRRACARCARRRRGACARGLLGNAATSSPSSRGGASTSISSPTRPLRTIP